MKQLRPYIIGDQGLVHSLSRPPYWETAEFPSPTAEFDMLQFWDSQVFYNIKNAKPGAEQIKIAGEHICRGIESNKQAWEDVDIEMRKTTAMAFYCTCTPDGHDDLSAMSLLPGDGTKENPFVDFRQALMYIYCVMANTCFKYMAILHVTGKATKGFYYPRHPPQYACWNGNLIIDGMKDGESSMVFEGRCFGVRGAHCMNMEIIEDVTHYTEYASLHNVKYAPKINANGRASVYSLVVHKCIFARSVGITMYTAICTDSQISTVIYPDTHALQQVDFPHYSRLLCPHPEKLKNLKEVSPPALVFTTSLIKRCTLYERVQAHGGGLYYNIVMDSVVISEEPQDIWDNPEVSCIIPINVTFEGEWLSLYSSVLHSLNLKRNRISLQYSYVSNSNIESVRGSVDYSVVYKSNLTMTAKRDRDTESMYDSCNINYKTVDSTFGRVLEMTNCTVDLDFSYTNSVYSTATLIQVCGKINSCTFNIHIDSNLTGISLEVVSSVSRLQGGYPKFTTLKDITFNITISAKNTEVRGGHVGISSIANGNELSDVRATVNFVGEMSYVSCHNMSHTESNGSYIKDCSCTFNIPNAVYGDNRWLSGKDGCEVLVYGSKYKGLTVTHNVNIPNRPSGDHYGYFYIFTKGETSTYRWPPGCPADYGNGVSGSILDTAINADRYSDHLYEVRYEGADSYTYTETIKGETTTETVYC